MKKIFAIISASLLINLSAHTQNEIDALRYSQLSFSGTTRFTSMGGAFGALGADASSLSFNPAGIALYRKGEITISPGMIGAKTTSTYNGTQGIDNRLNVYMNNLALIITFMQGSEAEKPGWRGVMLGFGYNRTNNFNNRTAISGKNNSSSLLDVFTNDAAGFDTAGLDAFGSKLAYKSGLITSPSPGVYNSVLKSYGNTQEKGVDSRGYMSETVITIGGNYSDKLFLGATFAFPHLKYYETSSYKEVVGNDSLNTLRSFTYDQNLTTKGTGFNLKFGMIYKPIDWIRIGGAVHTPTYFTMNDNWSSTMKSVFDNTNYEMNSPDGNFDYNLSTPMRAIASLGFVIQKMGLVGIDYELVDYSSANLSSSSYKYFDENTNIRGKYTSASNIRLGTEWKLEPLSIRAGYAMYGSPYRTIVNNDGSRTSYTAGIGFRENNFFMDFGYVYTVSSEKYYLYNPALTNAADIKTVSSSYMMTLGIRF